MLIDFKGEYYRLTARHRETAFGHRCVALDPYRVVAQLPDCLNLIDAIDADSDLAIDDVRDLASAMVVRTGNEKEPHWLDSAEAWISALLALVVRYGQPGDRSLQTMRNLLADPAKIEAAIKLMCGSDAWGGMLARMGGQLANYKERELNSTLTTTNRFLRFLDTPAVAESTKLSTFDPADLRLGSMTVYLILPPDHMRAQSALLRMWIGAMFRAVVRGGLQERNKVLFILDEAASLGHLESLDDAISMHRGYGVRLQFYYQSLGQMKLCFPEGQDQTLLSNTTQIYFAINDYQTAEQVSNRLGEHTVMTESGGASRGGSRQSQESGAPGSVSASWNTNDNWNQVGRKLLKPEELMTLHDRIAITFVNGLPPICTRLVRYYEEDLSGAVNRWRRLATASKTLTLAVLLFVCMAAIAFAVVQAWRNVLP